MSANDYTAVGNSVTTPDGYKYVFNTTFDAEQAASLARVAFVKGRTAGIKECSEYLVNRSRMTDGDRRRIHAIETATVAHETARAVAGNGYSDNHPGHARLAAAIDNARMPLVSIGQGEFKTEWRGE